MALTDKEVGMLDKCLPSEHGGSKATSQILHGLFFTSGDTIANLVYVSDIPYKGHVENIAVRKWNYEKFQIVQGISSARYPPTAHIVEIRAGIRDVLKELKKGNWKYDILKEIPEARQICLPERYRFFHTVELDDMGHFNCVYKYRLGVQDQYLHGRRGQEEWSVGDTFHGGYTLPEDVGFLENFLDALYEIKPPTRKQLEYIRDINTPG